MLQLRIIHVFGQEENIQFVKVLVNVEKKVKYMDAVWET